MFTAVVSICESAPRYLLRNRIFGKDFVDQQSGSPTIQSPDAGQIIAIPQVGGLHHRYERHAA